MISVTSCAPTANKTVVVKNQPKIIVVKKPRPNNKVIVVKPNQKQICEWGKRW